MIFEFAVSAIVAFCLMVCFLNLPLRASKSKHSSRQAVLPSPKGTLVNVSKPVTVPARAAQCSYSKPEATCPRSHPAQPCQAYPTTTPKFWSCLSPTGLPAECLILSGSGQQSVMSHPAPVSTGRTKPSRAASPMPGLAAGGQWAAALGTPSCRAPSPRHGWLRTSPSTGANLDLLCSHLHWQLSPSPLPV